MCEGALLCVNPNTLAHSHTWHTPAVTSMYRMAHQHNLIVGKQKLSSMAKSMVRSTIVTKSFL